MRERVYESEDIFQDLLAKYPALIAGDLIDATDPRRWLLVTRETGLPSDEGGVDRWSVDHLFLDQDGVPTIVEVKRSTDTRIRREVVGQMLEYAANAVVYWPADSLRDRFEERCRTEGLDASQLLADCFGNGGNEETFWQSVQTNLQAGKVRMLFVADAIPSELRRIVEFLNTQMTPAEVLAVEIKQYTDGRIKTLVPRVYGQTVEAEQKKAGTARPRRPWDAESFLTDLETRHGSHARHVAEAIMKWAHERGLDEVWGTSAKTGSWTPLMRDRAQAIRVYTSGYLEIGFAVLQRLPPFDDASRRLEFLEKLNEIPGVSIASDKITRYPSLRLSVLQSPHSLKLFLDALDWVRRQMGADA
jgi:hypothetical protein